MNALPYRDSTALWRALTARARTATAESSRPGNELIRRFVYDRFLARVFADLPADLPTGSPAGLPLALSATTAADLGSAKDLDFDTGSDIGSEIGSDTDPTAELAVPHDSGWVLKGGTAVLARVHDARHSKDVDLLRRLGDIDDALAALRVAASRDLGDHFRFVLKTVRPLGGRQQPGLAGYRVQVEAYCGVRRCETFGIDLVTGSVMTSAPELVRSSTPLDLPGLPAPTVRAYPIVDHIADKVAATEARYGNEPADPIAENSREGAESTRVRDLIDLIVLARTQHVDGAALHTAIAAERTHRGLPHRGTFSVPAAWAIGYPPLAAVSTHCRDLPQLARAVAYVAAFLEPAMTGQADHCYWSPSDHTWQPNLATRPD